MTPLDQLVGQVEALPPIPQPVGTRTLTLDHPGGARATLTGSVTS